MPDNKHYEVKCHSCGVVVLAKPGKPCANCGGSVKQGAEYTRKTFGADDHDLKKGG